MVVVLGGSVEVGEGQSPVRSLWVQPPMIPTVPQLTCPATVRPLSLPSPAPPAAVSPVTPL